MTFEYLPKQRMIQKPTKWTEEATDFSELIVMAAGENKMMVLTGAVHMLLGHELRDNPVMVIFDVRDKFVERRSCISVADLTQDVAHGTYKDIEL